MLGFTRMSGSFSPIWHNRLRLPSVLVATLLLALPAAAKENGLSGVMIFMDAGSPAYVQFNGLLVNGKLEMKACGTGPTLDKNAYKNLAKIQLNGVKSLERKADGSLEADIPGAGPKCVVPSNFKFEKDGTMTLADLVDKSSFTAQVAASQPAGTTALPPLTPGSKIAFVPSNDTELAEYLRADWAATIPQWKSYLSSYGTGPHTDAAKKSLDVLLLKDGQTELAAYRKSKTATPTYTDLKAVRVRVGELLALDPKDAATLQLQTDLQAELDALCGTGKEKLAAYEKGLADHTKGYTALMVAKTLSDAAVDVDPKYPAALSLQAAVKTDATAFDTDIKAAQVKLGATRYDDAYEGVRKYLSFQDEEEHVKAIVQAAYKYHMDHGAQMVAASKWPEAVADYTKANDDAPTDASKAALAKAKAGQQTAQNEAAAKDAVAKSQEYLDAKDYIHAYEVLLALTPDQRKLVATQMETVEPLYVTAATDMARKLQQTHSPIRGRADEDAMRQAYVYLDTVDKLTDNPDVKVRIDLLSDAISGYYVTLAKKYMDKPVASGVGVGWSYLGEASQYRPGLPVIRDEMAKANLTYQMRSRLSVGVVFRDQTSRRDSVGFAEQLQDAIATGLEASRLPVRVIRPGSAPAGLDPNYQLIGEILQHRTIKAVEPETLKSNYRYGERETPNEAWNRADQDYQDIQAKLEALKNIQRAAVTKGNKKAIEEANGNVDEMQKKSLEARGKLNMTPKTLQEDVIRPYNYIKQTISITNVVEMSFRIIDASGSTIEESVPVSKSVTKKFTVLQNIKADDTEGVHDLDSPPDEAQLMTDVEIAARDELVKLAHDRVVGLPGKILTTARSKARGEDSDAAAELYILYLNSTQATETPERAEATRFLLESYNLRRAATLSASNQ